MVDILIFMGQSNMQGQCEKLCEPNVPVERALEYRYLTDSLEPLVCPAGEDIKNDGSGEPADWSDFGPVIRDYALLTSVWRTTNMVPAFCKSYIEATGHEVIAIHAAKGSTTVGEWLPGTPCFDVLIKKLDGFFHSEKIKPEIGGVYIAWLQGESDAIYGTGTEAYKERLLTLKNELKKRYPLDYFGVIKIGRFCGSEKDQPIFDAQEQICAEDPDFVMLTRITEQLVDLPAYMNPHVGGHFSSDGQQMIGKIAGANLARIIRKEAIIDPKL